MKNTLAYYFKKLITAVKRFNVQVLKTCFQTVQQISYSICPWNHFLSYLNVRQEPTRVEYLTVPQTMSRGLAILHLLELAKNICQ